MKICVKKNGGGGYRKYRMEMKDDEDVYDLMEKCRKDWEIDEDTAVICCDEAGTEYDIDVKLSELEGKVLIMRHNQPQTKEGLKEIADSNKELETKANASSKAITEKLEKGAPAPKDCKAIQSMLGDKNLSLPKQDGLAELRNRDEISQSNTAVNRDCPIEDEEAFLNTQVNKLNNYGLKGIKYVAIKNTLCDDDGSKEKTLEFSSETENKEKKSHIASVENFKSWDVEGHINCLGVHSVHGGGGRSNSDVKQEGSKTEGKTQTNVAVVERWGFQTLKKFKVQACIQENLFKEAKDIAKLPANNQTAQVAKMMRKYCGQVFEGTCYIGGYFQMRAITRSEGQADFSSLVTVANKELKRHWEMGAAVDGTLLGVGAGVGASGGQLSRHSNSDTSSNSTESTKTETMTNIQIESKPGNCKNINEIVSNLEIPSKWTVFRDPDACKEDFIPFHEILRRHGDSDLVMVADIIKELSAAEEDLGKRLVSGYYDYLIQTKTSGPFRNYITGHGAFCLEVANYSARSLTSHIHEVYPGEVVDKQRDVMPGGVEGLLVTNVPIGTVSWLLGHGKMLVISYNYCYETGGFLCLTVCRQCDNSDWARKVLEGVNGGDQPKCNPEDGTLPNIGHSVGSGRVAKNSEATLCLQDDQDYVVTAKVKMVDKGKMFAEVRVYPRQVERWEEGLRKKMIQ
eukprot:TRINITY_DN12970_c0_g1_i5.p1 TRINITY_DN12970_c0_g1~~TRINITY_DN12970_c0_g1_i5.p1  ORF type:complete len:684 (-),score=168.51 TRINITY_DN12970_c0_g1_i5:109-2160(-)